MRISSERINWRFALGELFLIVAGILIALGIDSYAGRRADQATADAYVRDLVLELRADSANLETRRAQVDSMIASASRLLLIVQGDPGEDTDFGGLLMGSLFGEGVTPESVVWEELRTTGGLRLIQSAEVRTGIVAYYLDRSSRFATIDENFSPAVRALRSLAWDVLPVQSFATYFQTRGTGVPNELVLSELQIRDDAEFLLKRLILTGTVARGNLGSVVSNTGQLLNQLSDSK